MKNRSRKNLTRPQRGRQRRDLSRGSVKLKSTLETYCYDQLREAKIDFEYESETFSLMDSFRYPGIYHKSTKGNDVLIDATNKVVLSIKYTPDFISHKDKFIIETKGYVPSQHTFPLRWKLFLNYLNDNNMSDYMLFIPKNKKQIDRAIEIIKRNIDDRSKA